MVYMHWSVPLVYVLTPTPGKVLSGKAMAGKTLTDRVLAGKTLAGKIHEGKLLTGSVLGGNVPHVQGTYRQSTCRHRTVCKVQLANYTYAKYWLVMYQKAKYLMCRLQVGKVHTGKSPCAKYNWQTTRGQSTSQSKYHLAMYWLVKYDRQNRRCAKYYTGKLTGVQPTNDLKIVSTQNVQYQNANLIFALNECTFISSLGIANLDIDIDRCKFMDKRIILLHRSVFTIWWGCSGDIVAAQCCSIAFFSRSLIVMTVAADTLDTNFYLK